MMGGYAAGTGRVGVGLAVKALVGDGQVWRDIRPMSSDTPN
jgi:hypothetical protein